MFITGAKTKKELRLLCIANRRAENTKDRPSRGGRWCRSDDNGWMDGGLVGSFRTARRGNSPAGWMDSELSVHECFEGLD